MNVMPIQTDVNLKTTGKIGNTVYYESNGEKKSRPYFIPVQPGTPAQLAWWEVFRDGVSNYQLLSSEVKAEWEEKAKPLHMEGFNLFMSRWLKEKFDMISKILLDTYTGDGSSSRILDLGDDYDEVNIFLEEAKSKLEVHLISAYAYLSTYGASYQEDADGNAQHVSQAEADVYFKGKMFTSGDETKIKLGGGGTNRRGTNFNTWTYRIVAKKYRVAHSLP